MSDLQPPLRTYMPTPVDEETLARIRSGVDVRRRRRRRGRVALAVVLVTACGAAALALGLRPPSEGTAPAPLHLRDGRLPRVFQAAAQGPAVLRSGLDDGSEVAVKAGSRARVIANDGRRFDLRLERGTSSIHVVRGGPRTWVIRCDPVRVEVLGTRLHVECTPTVARIRVTESRVRVTGGMLPHEGIVVSAGQQIEVRRSAVVETVPSPAPPRSPPTEPRRDEQTRTPEHSPRPAPAVSGEPPDAVSILMSDADEARRAGKHAEAAAMLDRIAREHPGRPEAPLAAFMQGRLLSDRLGRPVDAAAAFEHALVLGLPAALAEDARSRVVQAWARAGQRDRAAAALEDLRRHHPASRRIRDAERWIEAIGTR